MKIIDRIKNLDQIQKIILGAIALLVIIVSAFALTRLYINLTDKTKPIYQKISQRESFVLLAENDNCTKCSQTKSLLNKLQKEVKTLAVESLNVSEINNQAKKDQFINDFSLTNSEGKLILIKDGQQVYSPELDVDEFQLKENIHQYLGIDMWPNVKGIEEKSSSEIDKLVKEKASFILVRNMDLDGFKEALENNKDVKVYKENSASKTSYWTDSHSNVLYFKKGKVVGNGYTDDYSLKTIKLIIDKFINDKYTLDPFIYVSKDGVISKDGDASCKECFVRKSSNPQKKIYTSKFDALSDDVKAVLIASVVDYRTIINGEVLRGFNLTYQKDNNIWYVLVSSGIGRFHPIYKVEVKADSVSGIDGVVGGEEFDTFESVDANKTKSKADLYKVYEQNQSQIEEAINRDYQGSLTVNVTNGLKDTFKKQRELVK